MIETEIEKFIAKNKESGKPIPKNELVTLNSRINGIIPDWFIEIVSKKPIAGLEVGWQAHPAEEDFDGVEWVKILDAPLLNEINLEAYPGMYLWPLGYFTFGYGSAWAGNCFAFNASQGEDPAVYEIWCDAGQSIEEIAEAIKKKNGVKLVNKSFSGFFRNTVKDEDT